MIIRHEDHTPDIDSSAYVAPSATICGNVRIGPKSTIMHGAVIVAEGGRIDIDQSTVIMENAVLRSTPEHDLTIGKHCLIGPVAHVVGATIEDRVFVATGAAIFHSAHLEEESSVRIHGIVHVASRLIKSSFVPIGWIAAGDPAHFFPPGEHNALWAVQKDLNFPMVAYGLGRAEPGASNMPAIAERYHRIFSSHVQDEVVG